MSSHGTFGRFYAGVETARTHALLVDAATLVGTGVIRHTADGDTLSPGVTTGARRADAHGLMIHAFTFGLRPTRFVVGTTDGDTFGILAGVCASAVVVAETPNVVAPNFRVSFVARYTSADRMVLDDLAGSSCSALTRIFTEAVDTSLFGRTLIICFANWSNDRYQRTDTVVFDHHTILTDAYHCPHWDRVNHSTLRCVVTWFEVVTRVFTYFVDAC